MSVREGPPEEVQCEQKESEALSHVEICGSALETKRIVEGKVPRQEHGWSVGRKQESMGGRVSSKQQEEVGSWQLS